MLRGSRVAEQFCRECEAMPSIEWSLPPEQHLQLLTQRMHTILARLCPKGSRTVPKQEWISSVTWIMCNWRASVLRARTRAHARTQQGWVGIVFDLWRHAVVPACQLVLQCRVSGAARAL
eukprot:14603942-Alexandrium_andersonii.AAC.1